MYEVFDSFLKIDTWSTRHQLDEERFFRALKKVVNEHDFNPDKMREYMLTKVAVTGRPADDYLNAALDHYRSAAWAVRSYLRTPDIY